MNKEENQGESEDEAEDEEEDFGAEVNVSGEKEKPEVGNAGTVERTLHFGNNLSIGGNKGNFSQGNKFGQREENVYVGYVGGERGNKYGQGPRYWKENIPDALE